MGQQITLSKVWSRDTRHSPWDLIRRGTSLKSQTIIRSGTVLAFVVLLINVCFMISTNIRFGSTRGTTVLYEGKCSKVSGWNSGIHVVINIFSIVLLAASNYAMQCLSSPTRQEIDKAHSLGHWLDIGVPSLRNLMKISRRRSYLWIGLAASSLPIAFM